MKKFSTFLEAEGSWRKETPWRKVKPGPRKDKYGNTVKDKNVARNLARSAMKKTASGKTDEGYIGAKGEKGRDYHNAGTFDKDTAYSHAKKHNGVVHKDPSGKYLVKHGRGKHVSEESTDEAYRKPTQAEIDADRKKDQKGKPRPSLSYKSVTKKLYKNMRNEEDVQELSTDKLKQYKTKAAADAANAARAADRGDPEAASRQDKRNRGLARAMKKEGFAVKYNNPGHEKHGREKHFDNKMAADKHANRGNKVDKVGGKYTVHKTNDKGHIVASYRETNEATYQGKKVPLNKPMPGDVKKSKVYVDPDGDGVAKKVNFGDKNMRIKKNIPGRRKSFRARHNCDNPGPKDKARYWSCKAW